MDVTYGISGSYASTILIGNLRKHNNRYERNHIMFGLGKASQQEVMMLTHRFTMTEKFVEKAAAHVSKDDYNFFSMRSNLQLMINKFKVEGIRKRDVKEVADTLELIAIHTVNKLDKLGVSLED